MTRKRSIPSARRMPSMEKAHEWLVICTWSPSTGFAIGIANPVLGDHVQMTNHSWAFSIEGMRRALGMERFLVINDFTALAYSLPALGAEDVRQVGGGQPVPGAALGLVGPGTGLGVSGLLAGSGGRGVVPIVG